MSSLNHGEQCPGMNYPRRGNWWEPKRHLMERGSEEPTYLPKEAVWKPCDNDWLSDGEVSAERGDKHQKCE